MPSTITDVLRNLKRDGFFREGKTLTEINEELTQKGFNSPVTTLPAVLLSLLRRGEITRIRDEEQLKYVE